MWVHMYIYLTCTGKLLTDSSMHGFGLKDVCMQEISDLVYEVVGSKDENGNLVLLR